MIIVQTPLRVSFFGGGTDFPSFFMEEGGCVLNSAIDKFIFLTIKERFDDKLRVGYTRTEMVDGVDFSPNSGMPNTMRVRSTLNGKFQNQHIDTVDGARMTYKQLEANGYKRGYLSYSDLRKTA